MVPDPSLTINEVIITSLLFVKIIKGVCHFFLLLLSCHTPYYLGFLPFAARNRWDLDSGCQFNNMMP